MNIKRIAGAVAAGVIAVGVATVPVEAAQASSAAPSVSAAPVVAQSATADRKKKKPKVRVNVAPSAKGCYDITVVVTKAGVPVAGAAVRFQTLVRGKWRKASQVFTADANGYVVISGNGFHNTATGGPSNSKARAKYKGSYSNKFRAPCSAV